jgi:hypothetical protein
MNNLTIREEKKRRIRKILKLVRPRMHMSGFVESNGERIKVWTPKKEISIPKNLVIKKFHGVTEKGIITDIYIGMLVQSWKTVPIEDLIRIQTAISRNIQPVLFV